MGFLRRLLGGTGSDDRASVEGGAAAPVDDATIEADERARELELARFDQERSNDLIRRQQQYADRSWTPPAQGGDRRADDGDAAEG